MQKRKRSPTRLKGISAKSIRIVVTAGPTRAFIDPVRYISNLSTGRMGYEIAREAARKKLTVTLISGPTYLRTPRGIRFVPIVTVDELEKAVLKEAKAADILFMVAAVNDYIPIKAFRKKLRRQRDKIVLALKRSHDIIACVAKLTQKPVLVGFSLETERLNAYTRAKLMKKGLDLIVGNEYSRRKNPFGDGKPSVLIVDKSGESVRLPKLPKAAIARLVLSKALAFLRERGGLSGSKRP